jgi:cytochrome c-type biogenesis protein CcmH/NrfG
MPDEIEMEKAGAIDIPEVLPEVDYSVLFSNAQSMVEAGDYASAQPALNTLIVAEQNLDDIIALAQEALNRDPTDFNLLLTLGDAYGRSGKLQNALDAYTKAEEYLQ